jgi:hypothetical protein
MAKHTLTLLEARKLAAELRACKVSARVAEVRFWLPWKIKSARLWAYLVAKADRDSQQHGYSLDFLPHEGVDYPRGFNEFMVDRASLRACAICGCTDDLACEGGCHWVGPNLCSACETRA